MKRIPILGFLLMFALIPETISAQTFGNEWINYNQEYYKIKVGADGIYKIDYSTLVNAGIPVATVDPRNFQLIFKGTEQYIYVRGEDDGSFDAGDFIEFYGMRNNGELDTRLYQKPEYQPNTYYSLFTDTSAYFLTWNSSQNGKRVTLLNDTSYTGKLKEDYYVRKQVKVLTDSYYDGPQITAYFQNSYYTEGEGWMSYLIGLNQARKFAFTTKDVYASGPAATVSAKVFGKSDAYSDTGYNHHTQMQVSPGNNNYTLYDEKIYKGYQMQNLSAQVPLSDFGSNRTNVQLRVEDDLDAVTDYIAISHVEMRYPAQFLLDNNSQFAFTLMGLKGPESYLEWQQYPSGKSAPVFYDLSNQRRITGTVASGTVKVLIPGGGTEKDVFLADTADIQSVSVEPVTFTRFSQAISPNTDFLIITHSSLMSSAAQYSAYRSSRGFYPYVVTASELYDQFTYGVHFPWALRNFTAYLIDQSRKPEFVLLLGKGLQNDVMRMFNRVNEDLVPTIGFPASDNMMFAGLDGTGLEAPFAIGRLAAVTDEQVLNYLDKLKTYESTGNEAWRKNIFHLSGGRDKVENVEYRSYLETFAGIVKEPFMGGVVSTVAKDDALPVSSNWKEFIINKYNEGVSFSSYFGHGALEALELEIGEADEYSNYGKYPVMYYLGCILGNSYTDKIGRGERFIFEKDKGAIAWMGGTSYGFTSYLFSYARAVYSRFNGVDYGKSIGEIIQNVTKNYQNQGDLFNEMQCLQTSLQGDPAIKIYSPQEPDFATKPENLFIYPEGANAESDSFAIGIIITNIGKAVEDSFNIRVTRTYPNATNKTYDLLRLPSVRSSDTLYFWIADKSAEAHGNNKFKVELNVDPDRIQGETNVANNIATIDYFMPANGIAQLYPRPFGIVANREVEFLAQANNLFLKNATYEFEADTSPEFNSNSRFHHRSGLITGNALIKHKVTLQPDDSTVYYWRVRITSGDSSQKRWKKSSFSYIAESHPGWSQMHFPQFEDIHSSYMEIDSIDRKFTFKRTTSEIFSVGAGGINLPFYYRGISQDYKLITYQSAVNGIALVAINPDNLEHFFYPSKYNTSGFTEISKGPKSAVFYFNYVVKDTAINMDVLDSIYEYINRIPEGYKVIGFGGRIHLFDKMPEKFFEEMEKVGAYKIRTVPGNSGYTLMGEKGFGPGEATEKMADPLESTPIGNQFFADATVYYPLRKEALAYSAIIGPSRGWDQFSYNAFAADTTDSISFTIFGRRADGSDTLLVRAFDDAVKDISMIDHNKFPFLQVLMHLQDNDKRTPPQLRKWIVTYSQVPEATLNPEIAYSFYADSLQQGDSLRFELGFQNISEFDMDSILVLYTITDPDRKEKYVDSSRIQPLKAQEDMVLRKTIPTKFLKKTNRLQVTFNPLMEQPEQYLFNNTFNKSFHVYGDGTNPLLDVTFDGFHIMSGDIVSPSPNILVTTRDENPYFKLNDTAYIQLSLIKPGSSVPEKIWFGRSDIEFIPATSDENKASVRFTPKDLPDGLYTLQVQAQDASGNEAGETQYSVEFEVINKSSISHFYPYPNPFSTRMKFVFTLTGAELPDYIKVQIMTVSGKVVKEININDFGRLRIGNNTTDYCWDGTDEFGDRLANGVYFYQVYPYKNNQRIEHRETAGESYFKKNVGKIVLVR